jgi:hypothetical protein
MQNYDIRYDDKYGQLALRAGTVAVGCHWLPIGLFEPFSPASHLRPVATGCARWAP